MVSFVEGLHRLANGCMYGVCVFQFVFAGIDKNLCEGARRYFKWRYEYQCKCL